MELSNNDSNSSSELTIDDLLKRLKDTLQQELIASDALISMFVSAMKENEHEIGLDAVEVMQLVNETPNLWQVLAELKMNDCLRHDGVSMLNATKIEWLHWLAVEGFALRMLNSDEYVQLMASLVREGNKQPNPLHIFESVPPGFKVDEIKEKRNLGDMRYAFYVGHLSDFYVIAKNGFIMYSCRRNHFDAQRLILLPDLASALQFLQYNKAWCGSLCGSKVGCVALCCYLNDPQRVHLVCNAFKDEIIVDDSDLVSPRFILFYGNRGKKEPSKGSKMP